MTKTDLYPLAREAMEALAEHYSPAMQRVRDDAGMQPADWGPVFLLSYADPRPETAAYLQQLAHYPSLPALEARLAGAASRGLLEATPDRAYRLTDKGRRMLQGSLEAAWKVMADLEPIGRDAATRLADLLKRVVEASVDAPEPQDKRHLMASRAVDPGDELSIVARLDQYLTDLALFRDDVHPAAWQPYNVNGAAWEIFTLIWSGEAVTLEALTERLKNRGHSADLVPQALQELVAREWIAKENGGYRATEQGKRLRQEAEDETDRLFYAPWASLGGAEREELRDLLTRLRDGARAAVAQNTG